MIEPSVSSAEETGDSGVILRVSNLSVRSKNVNILENINFEVRKGDILAIVGPNGAGKTTLIRAIMGIIPYSGTVHWKEGIRIGYVPQSLVSTDFPVSVKEFLSFKNGTGIKQALELAGIDTKLLNVSLSALSGGELQRVLLAWAIMDLPDVLMFDEPTSFVDIGSEEPIYERVSSLKEEAGITTIVISHNLHVVAHFSDRLLAVNRKQLFFGKTEDLSHNEIMNYMSGGIYPEFHLHNHQEEE